LCLIIDANKTADFVNRRRDADHQPIYRWLERDGRLAIGGRLLKEQYRVEKAKRYLLQLLRAGRALRCDDGEVNAEERQVGDSGLCRSDDPHVIALARVSGARVLFTGDRDLMADFGNPQLVPGPRGKIYKRAEHEHLLRNSPPCRRPDQRPPLPQQRA